MKALLWRSAAYLLIVLLERENNIMSHPIQFENDLLSMKWTMKDFILELFMADENSWIQSAEFW